MLILLLIKPAFLQMLYELRMIPLESRKQILNELIPAVLDLLKLFQCFFIYMLFLQLIIYHLQRRFKFWVLSICKIFDGSVHYDMRCYTIDIIIFFHTAVAVRPLS